MMYRMIGGIILVGTALALVSESAMAQHFGRNKVQYRAFDFQVIETENFDIYFYEEERQAALDAARMVERSYARLSRVLQHEFRERKPIILYASHTDFQQTNALPIFLDEGTGGVTESYKNRVIMPFTGDYASFDHVLTHELVHVFQYDVIFRRGVMAEANPMVGRIPHWFMEGMAEYLAIGRIDPHTTAWLRDAVLAGYLRSIGEMNRRDDYLSYRFGQALWHYIGNKWGDEVVGILLQKAPRIGLERAFQTTLGMSLAELSQEWTSEVRSTYLPQLTDFQRPEHFAERLTEREKLYDPWYLAPAISPDGDHMVFVSQRDGFFFDLWLADARTGKVLHKLIESARDPGFESLRYMNSSASFSPDGRLLAFAAKSGGQDALYIYDVQRRRVQKRLTYDLNGILNPSWAPDGARIVFSGIDGGLTDLFITDLDGRLERLTEDKYAALLPAWSPDGRTIAFATEQGPDTDFSRLVYGNFQVALYHLDDGRVEVLPNQGKGSNLNPVWAPDGRSLIWVGDHTGTYNLYHYALDRKELERITDLLSGVVAITPLSPALSWAQDDGRLLFVYFENAGYAIFAVQDPRSLPRFPIEAPTVEPEPEPRPVAVDDATPLDTLDLRPDTAVLTGAVASFYREGDTFRPSAIRPESSPQNRPVSVLALLDSAELALPDTTDFTVRDYRVRFTPDVIGRPTIGAQVGGYYGNGVYGGSFIALSDMLGNHNILLAGNVNGSFSDAAFFAGYNFLKTRANFGVGLEQMPLYRYLGHYFIPLDGGDAAFSDVWIRDVIRQAQGVVSYPFSTFRRVEFGLSAAYMKRDLLFRGVTASREFHRVDERIGDLKFVQPLAAVVFDNTLFGWTGPIYGRRYRLQAGQAFGDFQYTEGLVDFRNYFNWGRRVVFASRFLSLARFGENADRFALFWGGPYFLRGYDGNSFDLRGEECDYHRDPNLSLCPARDQLIGSSAAIMNLEVRFPVITELQIGFLGNFPPVDAVLFFDGGMAWDNQVCERRDFYQPNECDPESAEKVRLVWDRKPGQNPMFVREPLFSTGVGLRFNVFYTVLRLDYAVPLSRFERRGRFSISFGPSF